ncbi:MAG: hypothetical protein MR654_03105 [Corynebacterium glucuronolyticum]|nr:hypothetical protein [Corynebacterium glucuronolyticum]
MFAYASGTSNILTAVATLKGLDASPQNPRPFYVGASKLELLLHVACSSFCHITAKDAQ